MRRGIVLLLCINLFASAFMPRKSLALYRDIRPLALNQEIFNQPAGLALLISAQALDEVVSSVTVTPARFRM